MVTCKVLILLLFATIFASGFTIRESKDLQKSIESDKLRTFTNGHGYQFIDFSPLEDFKTDIGRSKPLPTSSEELNEHSESSDSYDEDSEQEYLIGIDEQIDTLIREQNDNLTNDRNESIEEQGTNIDEQEESNKSDEERAHQKESTDKKDKVEHQVNAEVGTKQVGIQDQVNRRVNNQKLQRNRLFDNMKEKYITRGAPSHQDIHERIKRKSQSIPEPPRLPELNYDKLPASLRAVLSSTISASFEEKHDSKEHEKHKKTDEEMKQEIEELIEQILNNISPDQSEEETYESEEEPVKTYGMNLTENGGYVWNDLFNNGYSYQVGNPDNESQDTEDDGAQSSEEFNESNEFNEYAESNELIEFNESKESNESTNSETPMIDDIAANSDNDKSNESSEDIPVTTHKDKALHELVDKVKEIEAILKKDEVVENSNESSDEKPKTGLSENLWEGLMQNKDFWIWLEQWTALYMEQMFKHIKTLIRDEVSRQIEEYAEDMFRKLSLDEKKESVTDTSDDKLDRKTENSTEHTIEKNEHHTEKDKASKTTDEEPKRDIENSTASDKHQTENTNELKTVSEFKRPNDTDIQVDDKIIINGIEYPITHTSNLHGAYIENEDIKSGKEKMLHVNDLKTNKDKMQQFYANSVGNEKVTNIFVFYPSKNNLKDVISGILPRDAKHKSAVNKNHHINDNSDEDTSVNHDNNKSDLKTDKRKSNIDNKAITPNKELTPKKEITPNEDETIEAINTPSVDTKVIENTLGETAHNAPNLKEIKVENVSKKNTQKPVPEKTEGDKTGEKIEAPDNAPSIKENKAENENKNNTQEPEIKEKADSKDTVNLAQEEKVGESPKEKESSEKDQDHENTTSEPKKDELNHTEADKNLEDSKTSEAYSKVEEESDPTAKDSEKGQDNNNNVVTSTEESKTE